MKRKFENSSDRLAHTVGEDISMKVYCKKLSWTVIKSIGTNKFIPIIYPTLILSPLIIDITKPIVNQPSIQIILVFFSSLMALSVHILFHMHCPLIIKQYETSFDFYSKNKAIIPVVTDERKIDVTDDFWNKLNLIKPFYRTIIFLFLFLSVVLLLLLVSVNIYIMAPLFFRI